MTGTQVARPSLTTLPSGLRVTHQDHPGALASVYLWFDVGTVDEALHEAGAAHLLEHMLFKGTPTRGVGECASAIESMGGDLNAYTTWDQTVFHATVLAEHWESALEILADMVWNSRVDGDELAREKPVVVEEIRGYDDDPESVLDDAVTERLFPGHPYGRPVLGTEASVMGMSRETLVGFWRTHYTAPRCVLAVAGPMTHSDVLRAARSLTPPDGPPRAVTPELPLTETGSSNLGRAFDTPMVCFAWTIPADRDPRSPAFEILANALGAGRASLLQQHTRLSDPCVTDIWCTTYTRRTTGSMELGFVPLPDRFDEAIARVHEVLQSVASGGLTGVQVDRSRKNVLADLRYGNETSDSVAHDLAWYTGRHGDPEALARWIDAVASTTAESVIDAFASLGEPVVTVLNASDGQASPSSTSIVTAQETQRPIRFSGRDDGWPRQGPVVSVFLGVPGGRLLEPTERAGIAGMWASLLTTGAGSYDNVAYASELDRLSASISAIAGRNTLGIQLSVPAVNLAPAVEHLQVLLHEPHFDSGELDRLVDEARFDLDTLRDRPDEVLGRAMWAHTWAGHPWALSQSKTSLRRTTRSAVAQFHRTWFNQDSLHIGVAGSVEPEVAHRILNPLVAGLPTGPTLPERPRPESATPRTVRRTAGQGVCAVAMAFRSPAMGHPDGAAIRLASALLSAQSGRLFMALRERDSLAYSVWSRVWEGLDGGVFALGLTTDPERGSAALQGLRTELRRLIEEGPDTTELDRTRAMMLGQLAMGQQRASARALHLGLSSIYGRPATVDHVREELAEVTPLRLSEALAALGEPWVFRVQP